MTKTVRAVMEPNGEIRLLEPLTVTKSTPLLITVVADVSSADPYQDLLSERDPAEVAARRAEAEAEMRAGKTLTTAEAIKVFESRIADAGRN